MLRLADSGSAAPLGLDQCDPVGDDDRDDGGDEEHGQQRESGHLGDDEGRAERGLGHADAHATIAQAISTDSLTPGDARCASWPRQRP